MIFFLLLFGSKIKIKTFVLKEILHVVEMENEAPSGLGHQIEYLVLVDVAILGVRSNKLVPRELFQVEAGLEILLPLLLGGRGLNRFLVAACLANALVLLDKH